VLTRWVRVLATLGLGATASLVGATVPARAAAIAFGVGQQITVPGLVRQLIHARAQMGTHEEAQNAINQGARIEITCWAADLFVDDLITGCPVGGGSTFPVYSGSQLTVDSQNGVEITLISFYEKGGILNEDIADSDEIYIKARWVDQNGVILNAQSSQSVGFY
jgi:hypothetical protein